MFHHWRKKLAPILHPIRITKKIVMRMHAFSCTSHQRHVITLNFDWFNVLYGSFVIGKGDNFGFGFTTLD